MLGCRQRRNDLKIAYPHQLTSDTYHICTKQVVPLRSDLFSLERNANDDNDYVVDAGYQWLHSTRSAASLTTINSPKASYGGPYCCPDVHRRIQGKRRERLPKLHVSARLRRVVALSMEPLHKPIAMTATISPSRKPGTICRRLQLEQVHSLSCLPLLQKASAFD